MLNAENNQIKALPASVGDLGNLQTLNMKGVALRLGQVQIRHVYRAVHLPEDTVNLNSGVSEKRV